MKHTLLAASLAWAAAAASAQPLALPPAPKPPVAAPAAPVNNVVFVTLDGVRWEEFLGNKPDASIPGADKAAVFPQFWTNLASRGVVYGDGGSAMTIANFVQISMPAYESMFAGTMQPCFTNTCPRIAVETFAERLVRDLKLAPADVATFTTWDKILEVVEHVQGATFTSLSSNTVAGVFNADQKVFPAALSYLKARKPRFLYISLGDADDWGHADNYPKYLATLREYDDDLAQLATTLDGMGDYGKNTTLIVTTDHGRGKGAKWKDHGGNPDSIPIWLYARGPTIPAMGRAPATVQHSHLDIRPTIEALFGLCPQSGPGTGAPFPEIVSRGLAASLCPAASSSAVQAPRTTAPSSTSGGL